jgi:hypothetical protein
MFENWGARAEFAAMNAKAVANLTSTDLKIKARDRAVTVLQQLVSDDKDIRPLVADVATKLDRYGIAVKKCREVWRSIKIKDITRENLYTYVDKVRTADGKVVKAYQKYRLAKRKARDAIREAGLSSAVDAAAQVLGERLTDVLMSDLNRCTTTVTSLVVY